MRVLLAEDCPLLQRSIRALLEAGAITSIVAVDDGAQAVRVAIETMPDIVILDYGMPGLNGIQAARLIHAGGPLIPMILLTSNANEHLIAAAFSVGVRGYVVKSDASEDLLRAIHAVHAGSTFLSPGASRVLCEPYLPKRVVM